MDATLFVSLINGAVAAGLFLILSTLRFHLLCVDITKNFPCLLFYSHFYGKLTSRLVKVRLDDKVVYFCGNNNVSCTTHTHTHSNAHTHRYMYSTTGTLEQGAVFTKTLVVLWTERSGVI